MNEHDFDEKELYEWIGSVKESLSTLKENSLDVKDQITKLATSVSVLCTKHATLENDVKNKARFWGAIASGVVSVGMGLIFVLIKIV
jgi:hypothetical protein